MRPKPAKTLSIFQADNSWYKFCNGSHQLLDKFEFQACWWLDLVRISILVCIINKSILSLVNADFSMGQASEFIYRKAWLSCWCRLFKNNHVYHMPQGQCSSQVTHEAFKITKPKLLFLLHIKYQEYFTITWTICRRNKSPNLGKPLLHMYATLLMNLPHG